MQKTDPTDNGVGTQPASEDCLTLNIWRPLHSTGKPAPVMVWIHGGSYVSGSGAAPLFDGAAFARQVVLVTINYRLGRFGFFAHPALTAENPHGPLGDYGMMDMIAALGWVQRNITAFGGDPRNVTIFGESAGGAAVNHLMISPPAQGLYAKAIVESGIGREVAVRLNAPNAQGAPSAEDAGKAFAARMGVTGNDAAALRAIPTAAIVAAGDPDGEIIIVDSDILTMDVADAFSRGLEARIPYIVGSNGLELPQPPAAIKATLDGISKLPSQQRAQLDALYGSETDYAANILSDIVFTEPARFLAAEHAAHGNPAWLYRFEILSPTAPKSLPDTPHGQERQYVFQTLSASPWPTVDADRSLATTVSAYWADFAKSGDPNGPTQTSGRPHWPRYSASSDLLLDFTNSGPVAEKTPRAEQLNALASSQPH